MSAESSVRPAVLGVIPARLGSERLPRKPLHDIAGRPLIEWVWLRARAFATLDALVIATDSPEVVTACRDFGATAVLTGSHHESGTDRVAEAAARSELSGFGIIVNIQGDEPFVTESQVAGAVDMVRSGWDIGTAAAPVAEPDAWTDPSVVKVVRNDAGGAMYFSRSPIPHFRGRNPTRAELASDRCLRHIGVYACSRDALERWVALPVSELERTERLEQLRPLAAGLGIGVALVEAAERGVDTREDAARAAARLRREGAGAIHATPENEEVG